MLWLRFRHDDLSYGCETELQGPNGVAVWHSAFAHFDNFDEANTQRGEREDPHAGLGFLYVARGQLEEAARELRTAKELDFRLLPAREELGFVLFLLGKNEEALWEFREVVRVDPRLVRASSGLGMTLVRLGRVDEAQEKCDLAGSDADLAAARTISARVAGDYASYRVRP